MQVDVNPKILTWAREERGITLEEAAQKLKLKFDDLQKWENDGQGISFFTLDLIAKLYKRQTAAFFLPTVPKKIRKPKDCRNLATGSDNFSPDTMLAIRRTSRYLQVAKDVLGPAYWTNHYKWLEDFSGKSQNMESEIILLHDLLSKDGNKQSHPVRTDAAFRYWRNLIEERLGIFVFQFSMPENEIDGFSYAFDEFPYAIVVNSENTSVRKIFTLFHELSHILKHVPGACHTDIPTDRSQLKIELECNNFAGKFLVPKAELKFTESVDEIFEFAALFNVSGESYLRRLFEENEISKDTFFSLLEIVKEKSRNFKRKKQEGHPSMIIRSKSTRGNKFFNLVTTAATNSQMSFSVASDLLGLKVGSIRV